MFESLLGFLKAKDVKYDSDVQLRDISPMRIGGLCPVVAWPNDNESLVCVVNYLVNNGIEYKIVGRMTNLLVRDSGYTGVLIRTDRINSWTTDNAYVFADCGVTLPCISKAVAEIGLTGFEELSGIPGSVGGAVSGNAGAYGRDISDILESVTVIDRRGVVQTLGSRDISFSYRHSSLARAGGAVLSAVFRLNFDDSELIKKRMIDFAHMRKKSQPCDMRTLGSTFKRPSGGYASRMIDECGLKGCRIGGAEISEKHAGFIVNRGDATAGDVMRLMALARECVYARFGVELESEIEIL